MRVALNITTLDVGGAERQLVYLAHWLQRNGCELSVFVLGPPPVPQNDRLHQELREGGIPVHFAHAQGASDALRVVRQQVAIFKQFRPDIAQAFLAHANLTTTLAARMGNVPNVVTGIRVADDRQNNHRLWARFTQRWVTRHVAVSSDVANFAVRHMGIADERLVVIPNGVDARLSQCMPLAALPAPLANDRPLLLVPGRIDPQKRPLWVLSQCGEILKRLPRHQVAFIGQGSEQGELQRQLATHPLRDVIHYLGPSPHLPELMRASELVLIGSAREGMSNVLLEAMACRRAVVATEAEGVRQVLAPHDRHQVVAIDDGARFQRQVLELAENKGLRQRLARLNQERVLEEFSLDAMGQRYLSLYQSLVSS